MPEGGRSGDAGPAPEDRPAPLRVVFAGTPPFAAVSLAALLDGPHRIVAALTQPDRPAGRGRRLAPSAVKALALEHDVPVLQPTSLRDEAAVDELAALEPDVLVVVAYGLILPPSVLALPPLGCLNVHASLLPRWRGAAPVQRAILAGDAETGVCIMQMDAGLDTGDVLARAATPIGADENATELTARLAALGAATLGPALDGRRAGTLSPEPQPETGATYAAKLAKDEARLDFARPAVALHRQVRALHGWPVAETALEGERVRVWRSRLPSPVPTSSAESGRADDAPGTIDAVGADALRVSAGDGAIELLELQRPGERVVGAGAFAQGRSLVGRRLDAPGSP